MSPVDDLSGKDENHLARPTICGISKLHRALMDLFSVWFTPMRWFAALLN
jgi:hypothetical protein